MTLCLCWHFKVVVTKLTWEEGLLVRWHDRASFSVPTETSALRSSGCCDCQCPQEVGEWFVNSLSFRSGICETNADSLSTAFKHSDSVGLWHSPGICISARICCNWSPRNTYQNTELKRRQRALSEVTQSSHYIRICSGSSTILSAKGKPEKWNFLRRWN